MCRNVMLLRAVIREDMSMAMCDELVKDITRSVEYLDTHFTVKVEDKGDSKALAVCQASLYLTHMQHSADCMIMCT